jgi:glycerate dehydrogenase
MKAVFLDYDTVSSGDLQTAGLVAAMPDLEFFSDTDDSQIVPRIAQAEIVLLNKFKLTRDLLFGAKQLKLIALAATGTDNVDLAAAHERGIAVCNVRGYCRQSVMQQVWAMLLALTQHVSEYAGLVADGSWVKSEILTVLAHPIRELAGKTFGVVGWGDLGRAAAAPAQVFGMRVLIANRPGASISTGCWPSPTWSPCIVR